MLDFFELMKDLKPVYIVFLTLGIVAAVALHFLNCKKNQKFWHFSLVYALSLVLSILLSVAVIKLFNQKIAENYKNDYLTTNFSFLITLAFFTILAIAFSKILGLDFSSVSQTFVVSNSAFLLFAKLGCFFNGCCVSKEILHRVWHLNLWESVFSAVIIVLFYLKKTNVFNLFFLVYLPYRFLIEFVRESYAYQIVLFGKFTSTHLVSLIFFAIILIYIIVTKRKVKKA